MIGNETKRKLLSKSIMYDEVHFYVNQIYQCHPVYNIRNHDLYPVYNITNVHFEITMCMHCYLS